MSPNHSLPRTPADKAPASKGINLDEPISVTINRVEDIVEARQRGRDLAGQLGFSATQSTLIATIISELARNIILYATKGKVTLAKIEKEDKVGISIMARDNGPGISNVQRALMSGYSSSGGLGLGLPGVRKLADEFEIENHPGQGTIVKSIMWLR